MLTFEAFKCDFEKYAKWLYLQYSTEVLRDISLLPSVQNKDGQY